MSGVNTNMVTKKRTTLTVALMASSIIAGLASPALGQSFAAAYTNQNNLTRPVDPQTLPPEEDESALTQTAIAKLKAEYQRERSKLDGELRGLENWHKNALQEILGGEANAEEGASAITPAANGNTQWATNANGSLSNKAKNGGTSRPPAQPPAVPGENATAEIAKLNKKYEEERAKIEAKIAGLERWYQTALNALENGNTNYAGSFAQPTPQAQAQARQAVQNAQTSLGAFGANVGGGGNNLFQYGNGRGGAIINQLRTQRAAAGQNNQVVNQDVAAPTGVAPTSTLAQRFLEVAQRRAAQRGGASGADQSQAVESQSIGAFNIQPTTGGTANIGGAVNAAIQGGQFRFNTPNGNALPGLHGVPAATVSGQNATTGTASTGTGGSVSIGGPTNYRSARGEGNRGGSNRFGNGGAHFGVTDRGGFGGGTSGGSNYQPPQYTGPTYSGPVGPARNGFPSFRQNLTGPGVGQRGVGGVANGSGHNFAGGLTNGSSSGPNFGQGNNAANSHPTFSQGLTNSSSGNSSSGGSFLSGLTNSSSSSNQGGSTAPIDPFDLHGPEPTLTE